MLRLSGNEKIYGTFVGRLDARSKMLISAAVSFAVIFLSSPAALLLLAGAGSIYILSTGQYKIAAYAHALILFMFFTAYGCVWLIHFAAPSVPAPDSVKFTIPFLRTISVIDAVLAMALSSRIQDIFSVLGKLGLPSWLYIPGAVMIRFIPGFINEMKDISESIKIKGYGRSIIFLFLLSPSVAIRMFFMPLAVRSLRISDEIAVAAELKGIDASWKPSESSLDNVFAFRDVAAVVTVSVMLTCAFALQYASGAAGFIH